LERKNSVAVGVLSPRGVSSLSLGFFFLVIRSCSRADKEEEEGEELVEEIVEGVELDIGKADKEDNPPVADVPFIFT